MINFRDNGRGGFGGERRSFGRDRGSSGGGRRFGGDRGERRGGFGGRSSFNGRPEMHSATCAKCNENCQVPFRPSGDKPVYCSRCFEENGNSSSGFNSRGRDSKPIQSQSSAGISSEQFKQLNSKLDKIISILNTLEVAEEGDFEDEDELDEDEEDVEEDEEDSDEESKDKKIVEENLDEEDDSEDEEDETI